MKKSLVVLGHTSLLVTALLAIIFYKERALYIDSGQLIFEMLNEGKCKIFLGRYSMYITEIIPLLAIKSGSSLKTVLVIYSLSFIFVQYLCYLICVYIFKNVEAGLSIALAPLLIRMSFGQAVCEPWMAIAYSALFYAVFNYYTVFKQKGIISIIVFYFLLVLLVLVNYFMHPLSMFLLLFSIGFVCIYKNQWKEPPVYIGVGLIICMLASKFFFPSHPYESNYFEGLKHPTTILPIIFSTPMLIFIKKHFGELFLFFLIPLIFSSTLLIQRKKWGTVLFNLLFPMLYLIVIALSTYKGDAPMMLEIRIIPLIFMALIPFGVVIMGQKKPVFIMIGLLLLVTTSYLHIIHSMQKNHTRRLETYQYFFETSKKYSNRKFFVRLPHMYTPVNSWGSAAETLMLSSLEGPEYSKTIIFIDHEMHIEEGIHTYPCTFLWLKWSLYANELYLNKKYFNLQCSSYQELAYPQKF